MNGNAVPIAMRCHARSTPGLAYLPACLLIYILNSSWLYSPHLLCTGKLTSPSSSRQSPRFALL
ncbi:hypothetical protein BDV06DRAFT_203323 [Aspergillus oleicola]